MDRLKVCISVDTEFSIAGAFRDPYCYKPVSRQAVYCDVKGRSEGLGFILRTFKEFGIRGTFFIETLNNSYFGNDPMEKIVIDILAESQDVQLHIHPVWKQVFSVPGWENKLDEIKPNDSVLTRSLDQMVNIFGEGADTLKRWGGVSPIAMRTGNLHVNKDVYRAMSKVGIYISSNIGRGIYDPQDKSLKISYGCQKIEGVYEYPVTSYIGLRGFGACERKSLTIIGSSFSELKYLINDAYENQLGSVVVLTHPFEFIKGHDMQFNNARKNSVVQRRLIDLCHYMASNSDKFEPAAIAALTKKQSNFSSTHEFQMPHRYSLSRALVNKFNS